MQVTAKVTAFGASCGPTLTALSSTLIADFCTEAVWLAVAQSSPLFSGFRGKLDLNGSASATINVPGNQPVMSGLSAYHTCVILDASGFPRRATNATPLHLHN